MPPAFRERARRGAVWVREQGRAGRTVTVVHHIDADGVTAGAIAATALDRAGVACRLRPVKSLDGANIAALQKEGHEALWFCDLGSTAYMQFPATTRLVCDHHQLVRDGSEEGFPHVNPLLDGLDGGEVSGAGCAFAVAHELDAANVSLLPLALVGATADRQDRPLRGINAAYLAAAVAAGLAQASDDVSFFGSETRALPKFLALANEPFIPEVTNDRAGALAFLAQTGIERTDRRWSELTPAERERVRGALEKRLRAWGRDADLHQLTRQVIRFPREPHGPTREAQEFATLLNSTARYDQPDIGIAVARGDRGARYEEALDLLDGHRKHLVGALVELQRRTVTRRTALQWVHLEDAVRDTVVGIVAGMALGGSFNLAQDRPLIAFAWAGEGKTKVSSRAPHALRGRIDLATALREASGAVGGHGGGHAGAAGATIPRGQEPAFLAALDSILAKQLGLAEPVVATPPTDVSPQGAAAAAVRRAGQQLLRLG